MPVFTFKVLVIRSLAPYAIGHLAVSGWWDSTYLALQS